MLVPRPGLRDDISLGLWDASVVACSVWPRGPALRCVLPTPKIRGATSLHDVPVRARAAAHVRCGSDADEESGAEVVGEASVDDFLHLRFDIVLAAHILEHAGLGIKDSTTGTWVVVARLAD